MKLKICVTCAAAVDENDARKNCFLSVLIGDRVEQNEYLLFRNLKLNFGRQLVNTKSRQLKLTVLY